LLAATKRIPVTTQNTGKFLSFDCWCFVHVGIHSEYASVTQKHNVCYIARSIGY